MVYDEANEGVRSTEASDMMRGGVPRPSVCPRPFIGPHRHECQTTRWAWIRQGTPYERDERHTIVTWTSCVGHVAGEVRMPARTALGRENTEPRGVSTLGFIGCLTSIGFSRYVNKNANHVCHMRSRNNICPSHMRGSGSTTTVFRKTRKDTTHARIVGIRTSGRQKG
jgi:hypothetical protein